MLIEPEDTGLQVVQLSSLQLESLPLVDCFFYFVKPLFVEVAVHRSRYPADCQLAGQSQYQQHNQGSGHCYENKAPSEAKLILNRARGGDQPHWSSSTMPKDLDTWFRTKIWLFKGKDFRSVSARDIVTLLHA
jgi:hypothetical protein